MRFFKLKRFGIDLDVKFYKTCWNFVNSKEDAYFPNNFYRSGNWEDWEEKFKLPNYDTRMLKLGRVKQFTLYDPCVKFTLDYIDEI